jgi:hypothetical protein
LDNTVLHNIRPSNKQKIYATVLDKRFSKENAFLTHSGKRSSQRLSYNLQSLSSPSVADPDLPDPRVFETPGSESGSISQRYGSADPD